VTNPTIAFVHGAFADSAIWAPVLAELDLDGHPVMAFPNPLRGLRHDAAYLRSCLTTLDGPLVVVGHGYGGGVIGEACAGLRHVAGLVVVAGYLLRVGESLTTAGDAGDPHSPFIGNGATQIRPTPSGCTPDGRDLDIWLHANHYHRVLAQDLDTERARLLALTQRPLAVTARTETATAAAWNHTSTWALIAQRDHLLPAAAQQAMASRAGAHLRHADTSHCVPLSAPEAVVDVVLEASRHAALQHDRERAVAW
jgi:pimeloyl-ACP methyl ester carboxylesterase